MDAIIVTSGTAEEIAALACAVQERQSKDEAKIEEIVKAVAVAQNQRLRSEPILIV